MSEIGGDSDDYGTGGETGGGETSSGNGRESDGETSASDSGERTSGGSETSSSGNETGSGGRGTGGGAEVGGSTASAAGAETSGGFRSGGIGTEAGGTSGAEATSPGNFGLEMGRAANGTKGNETQTNGMIEGIDRPIDKTRIEPGINQILYYEPTMEEAKVQTENKYQEAVNRIMAEKGQYMTAENKARIEAGIPNLTVTEYNREKGYTGRFGGKHGNETIEVANKNPQQLTRTATHETTHFCSNNVNRIIPQGNGTHTVYRESGICKVSYETNSKGNIWNVQSSNRAFNEGLTTMYTNEQLAQMAENGELISTRNGYQTVTEFSQEVNRIVGEAPVAAAYYGGDIKGLEDAVNKMAGDEKAFEKISSNMDIIQNSRSQESRSQAAREIQDILEKMEKYDGE